MLLFLLIQSASSASVSAEKNVSSNTYKTGDDVKISLTLFNPFKTDLTVKIVDRNVFANNGLDIQCLEYTIPAGRGVELGYEPIKAYSPGNYTLGAAEITYVNPESGNEEKIYSKPVNISVSGLNVGGASGITTVYRCGGISMQSTSFQSSSFSTSYSINQNQRQQQSQQQTLDDLQKKVQNNQINQNTQALQKEVAEQKKIEEDFLRNLENNTGFKEIEDELKKQGYQLKEQKQKPEDSDSGSFERRYEKPSGEQAVIKGEMRDGEIKNLSTEYQDSPQKMMEALTSNPDFTNLSRQLREQGFTQGSPQFTPLGNNKTKISVPYNNSLGVKKNITAEYDGGNITKIELEEEKKEKEKDFLVWMILLVLLILTAFLLYNRFMKKKAVKREFKVEEEVEAPVDWRQEAKNMLKEALKLFEEGREKDAYEKVSQAVRYYYSMKLETKRELDASELLSLLKSRGFDYSAPQKCLNLCGMVEFARYKANKEDFKEIIKLAEEIIT